MKFIIWERTDNFI